MVAVVVEQLLHVLSDWQGREESYHPVHVSTLIIMIQESLMRTTVRTSTVVLSTQGTKLRSLIRLPHRLLTSFFRSPLTCIFSSSHYVIGIMYTYFPFDLALLAPCFIDHGSLLGVCLCTLRGSSVNMTRCRALQLHGGTATYKLIFVLVSIIFPAP